MRHSLCAQAALMGAGQEYTLRITKCYPNAFILVRWGVLDNGTAGRTTEG